MVEIKGEKEIGEIEKEGLLLLFIFPRLHFSFLRYKPKIRLFNSKSAPPPAKSSNTFEVA